MNQEANTMQKCNACGHQWTKGEKCPHCGSTDFESLEAVVEEVTPEPEVDEDSTESEEEE